MAPRNRRGMLASASATSCSNLFRSISTWVSFPGHGPDGSLASARAHGRGSSPAGSQRHVVVAIVAYGAPIAKRLRLADPPAVQDKRIGRERPAPARQRAAQLPLDDLPVV